MALYVTDTHALLWYLGGSRVLGASARAAFDGTIRNSDEVFIPAIVVAELIGLSEKRRSGVDVSQIMVALQEKPGFHLTTLTPKIVLGIRPLMVLRDLHDRLIVAEALAVGAALITRDYEIARSGLVQVIW